MNKADKRRQIKGPNKAFRASKSLNLTSPLPVAHQQTTSIQQAINLGIEYHQAGKLVEAEKIYHQVLQADPNQVAPLHMLGVLAYQAGNFDEALGLLAKVIVSAPNLAEAQNNMGLIQSELGNTDLAIKYIERALVLKPDYTDAHKALGQCLISSGKLKAGLAKLQHVFLNNPKDANTANEIGLILSKLGQHEEAITSFQVAIDLRSDFSDAHNNLGNTFRELRQFDMAIKSYQTAFASNPSLIIALHNQGATLQEFKKYNEAAKILKSSNHSLSFANLLECLYTLEKQNDFYSELDVIVKKDALNVGVAAISAFAANQFDRPDPYPYCQNPMELISHRNVIPPTDAGAKFLNSLSDQILGLNLDGGNQSLLQFGFQSVPSLFSEPKGPLQEIEKILKTEIESYFSARQYDSNLYITKRPTNYSLMGWYILMEKNGKLSWHHHPSGWLSGSFYINIPTSKGSEAAIEFSLHGNELPIINQKIPTKLCNVKAGDLVLFPSSLFHRTVPFHSDDTRLCIAFDLKPASNT